METEIKTKSIVAIVMSHVRPELLDRSLKAIDSLKFDMPVRKIVSDTSVYKPKIKSGWEYLYRDPTLTWIEHFLVNLLETKEEWVLITSDDDELLPTFADYFNLKSQDKNVLLVSGLAETVDKFGNNFIHPGYASRLKNSNIKKSEYYLFSDLLNLQFRFGLLLPFQAMAINRRAISKFSISNPNQFSYVFDYLYCLLICADNKHTRDLIAFKSDRPIFRYYLHGTQLSAEKQMEFEVPYQTILAKIYMLEKYGSFFTSKDKIAVFQQTLKVIAFARLHKRNDKAIEIASLFTSLGINNVYQLFINSTLRIPYSLLFLLGKFGEAHNKIYWFFKNHY